MGGFKVYGTFFYQFYIFPGTIHQTTYLCMKEGSLFVLFCFVLFVLMRSAEPGCFRIAFLVSLGDEGCIRLVSWRLDFWCKSS
jgi:hypothetical protein